MNRYRTSIVFFGGLLPFIGLAIVGGLLLYGRGKLHAKGEAKEALFSTYQESAGKAANVEEELAIEGRAEQMAYWDEQLQKEFVQSLTQNLNEITSQFSEEQLVRTEFSRPGAGSALASRTTNPHTRFNLSFEGGFGPMQTVLTELEVRMPQLVVEALQVKPVTDPGPKSKGRLRFDVTYLAWQDYEKKEGQ